MCCLPSANIEDRLFTREGSFKPGESTTLYTFQAYHSGNFIIDVLRKQQTKFIHTISNSIEEEDIELIEHWIEAGAINN